MIQKSKLLKRSANLLLLLIFMAFGLYIFELNKIRLLSLKPYYLKSYFEIADYSQAIEQKQKNNSSENQKYANSIPVLLYHGILNKTDGDNVELDKFSDQMFKLKRAGYETVTLQDLKEFLKGGKQLPEKSFVLTFDDGNKNSYYPADPILKKLNYKASIFIITDHSFKIPYNFHLFLTELKEMEATKRWDIQAHTKDGHGEPIISASGDKGHFFSDLIWLGEKNRLETPEEFEHRVTQDMFGAKQDIEKELNKKVEFFAFPFGDYGQESKNFPDSEEFLLRRSREIYPFILSQADLKNGSPLNCPSADPFIIKRINIDPNWDGDDLIKIFEEIQKTTCDKDFVLGNDLLEKKSRKETLLSTNYQYFKNLLKEETFRVIWTNALKLY